MATPLENLLAKFEQAEESAKAANLSRFADIMKIHDQIIARVQPGGAFEKAGLAELETAKTRAVGQTQQGLISAGLSGTTTAAQVGQRFEKEVGMPTRLKLEDIQQQRVSAAELGKAGAIERREDVGPDFATIANLAGQAEQAKAARPRQGMTTQEQFRMAQGGASIGKVMSKAGTFGSRAGRSSGFGRR